MQKLFIGFADEQAKEAKIIILADFPLLSSLGEYPVNTLTARYCQKVQNMQ